MQRTDTRIDDECERLSPGRRSGVVGIELRDGRKLEKRVLDPKGEGGNPMTDRDLEDKLRANCEPIIGAKRCTSLLAQAWRFDQLKEAEEFYRWD